MQQTFMLPVSINGFEVEFETKILTRNYKHRFQVNIQGINVLFEPDDNKRYRPVACGLFNTEHLESCEDIINEVARKLEFLLAGD